MRKPVIDVVEDFETRLDGVLVKALVSRFKNIHLDELHSIAGALYLQRDDENEVRTIRVLEHLRSVGELTETPEGFLALSGSP